MSVASSQDSAFQNLGRGQTGTSSSHDEDIQLHVEVYGEEPESLKDKVWRWWQEYCCLAPNNQDDFAQVLRKTSVSVLMPMVPVGPLSFAMYYTKLGFFPDEAPEDQPRSLLGVKVLAIQLYFYAITGAVPYLVLRWKRHLSTPFMDLHMTLMIANAYMVATCLPQWSCQALACCVAILAILAQTRFVILQCFFCAILYFLDGFNEAYRDEGIALVVPGYRHGPPFERMLMTFSMGVVMILIVSGVFAQSIAHIRHVSASKAAVEMSRRIVNLLRRYDTEGVSEALTQYQDVDPDLVRSLHLMNTNLETYKPFLPNYLFQEEESETEDDGAYVSQSDGCDSDDEGSLSKSMSCGSPGPRRGENGSESSRASQGTIGTAKSSERKLSGANLLPTHAGAGGKNLFEGKISFALVECPLLKGSTDVASANAFVECIYAAAEISKASVHSLVGDVGTISWNATHRVPQPEMKAVRFLSFLKKHQPLRFGAVVFSGVASCYSVTTSKRQHAHMISASWMPMAHEAFNLAKEHKCMLTDESTEAVSSNNFESVIVDRVAVCNNCKVLAGPARPDPTAAMLITPMLSVPRPSTGYTFSFGRNTTLFELLREVDHDDEEWMYQLEMKENGNTETSQLRETASLAFALMMESITEGEGATPKVSASATEVVRVVQNVEESDNKQDSDSAVESNAQLSKLSLIRRLDTHMRQLSLGRMRDE